MRLALLALFGVICASALALIAVVVVMGRTTAGITTGRLRRFARMGRLSARLSASFLGMHVRRLFADREARIRLDEEQRHASARRVAETMGSMKGAFMKLGQIMSFATDMVPAEYRAQLATLQDAAPPMEFPLLRDVAERELQKPLERAFARFDPRPLAAASIGQVHRATLPTGEEVAVKIQYPGVAEAIRSDLANASMLTGIVSLLFPKVDSNALAEELRARLLEELDYIHEAKNQRAFAELYSDHPFICIPHVIDSHSTEAVLTSEFTVARRFEAAERDSAEARNRYGEIIWRFFFQSLMRFGVFNSDPHPGNYLFDDQRRVVFLDFGCVKYFSDSLLRTWRRLVAAQMEGDPAAFYAPSVDIGFLTAGSEMTAVELYQALRVFYEPFGEDREFAFSHAYNNESLRRIGSPQGQFAGLQRKLAIPSDFLFVGRIMAGVYSVLSHLEARGNWHRISREYLYNDPPSTELGRIETEWRARWVADRNLAGADLALTPDGPRVRLG